jgi:hypothetical protein
LNPYEPPQTPPDPTPVEPRTDLRLVVVIGLAIVVGWMTYAFVMTVLGVAPPD